jgi:hypothetical protein
MVPQRRMFLALAVLTVGVTVASPSAPAAAWAADAPLAMDDGKSLAPDQQAYADAFGVSLEESGRNLDLQVEAGLLEGELSDVGEEWFGGLWVVHKPSFHVVVASVDPTVRELKEAVGRSTVADITEIRRVDRSLSDLRADAARLQSKADDRYRVEIDVQMNQLVLATPSTADTLSFISTNRIDLPANAVVRTNAESF